MSTYILTWNPSNWTWDLLPETIDSVRAGMPAEERWSSGNTKSIPIGSRVFLLRQGVEPKGIMASGWTSSLPYEDSHWDDERRKRGDLANFVTFSYETLLDPNGEPLLDPRDFPPGPVSRVHWAPPASGTSIPEDAAAQLESLWSHHIDGKQVLGALEPGASAVEGLVQTRLIKHRSRERALRNAKIRMAMTSGSLFCEVPGCGFDFEATYGEIGHGYAQVHHLVPLASLDGPTTVRLEDLSVVCANCHAMIHVGGKLRPLAGLIHVRS